MYRLEVCVWATVYTVCTVLSTYGSTVLQPVHVYISLHVSHLCVFVNIVIPQTSAIKDHHNQNPKPFFQLSNNNQCCSLDLACPQFGE